MTAAAAKRRAKTQCKVTPKGKSTKVKRKKAMAKKTPEAKMQAHVEASEPKHDVHESKAPEGNTGAMDESGAVMVDGGSDDKQLSLPVAESTSSLGPETTDETNDGAPDPEGEWNGNPDPDNTAA